MQVKDLNKEEFLPYFQPYINQIEELSLFEGLEVGLEHTINFFQSIPENKQEYRYADGKWTVKEIISHLIDSERVFCYRAMRFAREDETPLTGFDENEYALASKANKRTLKNLLEEYAVLRQATIIFFKSLEDSALKRVGVAGSGKVSVRALGFLISGHEKHHCQIIKERYL